MMMMIMIVMKLRNQLQLKVCTCIRTFPLLSLPSSLPLSLLHSLPLPVAYGYGSVMIFFISSLSLLGLFLVPCLNQRHRLGQFISRYVLTMLTAMGVSALLCDVMFELIPTVRLAFPPFNITSIPPNSFSVDIAC